ncbi:DUF7507 domain-containing protein [Microbacterium sp. ZOR0019]|uniref:DUF7507 domain-containing protein n=1 Tax=Microbacterium sp. ZOR0019 TaxID=1339233 RepID=UPI0006893076|nr:DUF11 domain-containing protein [Microbacterium sp. ZOR0019]
MIRRKRPQFAAGRASDGALTASWGCRALSGALALLLGVAGFTAAATAPANAAPGSPGTPQAANVLYEEDFENVANGSMTLLPSYTSASGLQYQADNAWLINCNGVVLDATSVGNAPNCGIITDRLRTLSRAFGIFNSDPNPALNHSLSAYTDNGSGGAADPGPNLVQFATTTPITLPPHEGKRYLGFSVDGAVDNYNSNPPQYQFYFVQGGVETPIGSPINGGTDPRGTVLSVDGRGIRVGSYATDAAVAVTGNSVGLALRNLVGTGGGNDGAIDNIRILDMTPQLDKSFSPTAVLAGGSSTLTFTVTNTSELGAKGGWSFVDNLPAGLSVVPSTAATTCSNGTVDAPGGATSITVTGDLLQGQSSCTITVDVTSPVSGSFTNGPDNIVGDGVNDPGTSTVDFVSPAVALTKSASTATADTAGQTITYTYSVTNTGDIVLSGISIDESSFTGTGTPPSVVCPPGAASLAPGATVDCTAVYSVTQTDVDAGQPIVNTATASGTPPVGSPVVSEPSTASVQVEDAPAVALVKSATPNDAASFTVGQVITFSFVVTNAGNVTLTDPQVDETQFDGAGSISAIDCPAGVSLAPGAQTTCTATYTLVQADVDAGSISNEATATATTPSGSTVDSPPSSVSLPADAAPSIELAKAADTTAFQNPPRVGDVVTYRFTATNAGNVTLHDVAITDPLPGLSVLTYDWPGVPGDLGPGQAVIATATYVITQADVDAGHVANSALASATPPVGPGIESPPAETDTAITTGPQLILDKTADDSAVQDPAQPGDVITYTFTATNTGNVTLTGVEVTDVLPGLSSLAYDWPGADGVLKPGDTVTATATYGITLADIDAGHAANSATATGSPPSGPVISSVPSETDTLLESAPALTLTKLADTSALSDPVKAGDVVTYGFTATNTGNVTLTGVSIVDALSGLSSLTYDWPGVPGTLAPGDVVTATATYSLLQSNIDAGHVANSAFASGTPPTGPPVESPPADTDTTLEAAPAMMFAKSADSSAIQNPAQVGDVITYAFTATNTGNVTLVGVTIADALPGLSVLTYEWPGEEGVLLPTDVVTATATYEITQSDINGGYVANTASVTGTPPTGPPVTTPESETDTLLPTVASLAVIKSVTPTTASQAGDVVTYSFVVTNTGTVTITDLSIDDTTFSGTNPLPQAVCPVGPLGPGAEATCSSSYTVSQEDVDAGTVTNTATATGLDPLGAELTSAPSAADLAIASTPALSLVKSASPSDPDEYQAGQVITYSFVVTNTGNVTIADLSVEEASFTGTGPIGDATCPSGAASLAPGDQVLCTTTYTLTQADVDAGSLTNSATATGTSPVGVPVTSEPSEVTIPATPRPELALVKSADVSSITARGQLITYSFDISNLGNVTVNDVTVEEVDFNGSGALSSIQCPAEASALAPGMTVTCTATYRVTALDLTGGPLSNSATASGTTLGGAPVSSPTSTAVIAVDVSPAPPKLPDTGAVLSWSLMLSALGLLIAGGVLRLARRKEAS